MLAKFLAGSCYVVILSVIGSLIASVTVTVYAAVDMVSIALALIREAGHSADMAKSVSVAATELIELFLLGTVLYIIALGLYQLFIDPTIYLPPWLAIHTIDSLKERLLSTVVVMLAVSFLGFVVSWDGTMNIIALGVGVGLVLASLAYILSLNRRYPIEPEPAQPHPACPTSPAIPRRRADETRGLRGAREGPIPGNRVLRDRYHISPAVR